MEEPWYWAYWGRDLYEYSYYLAWFEQTGNVSMQQKAQEFQAEVPADIVQEFLWRRARNHNITVALIEAQYQWYDHRFILDEKLLSVIDLLFRMQNKQVLFDHMFITQDDNAKHGLNIQEATEIKELVSQLQLDSVISVYPGADEVGFTMLARLSCEDMQHFPKVQLIWRDTNTTYYIPNYEGQPMTFTVTDQVNAAGGQLTNDSAGK